MPSFDIFLCCSSSTQPVEDVTYRPQKSRLKLQERKPNIGISKTALKTLKASATPLPPSASRDFQPRRKQHISAHSSPKITNFSQRLEKLTFSSFPPFSDQMASLTSAKSLQYKNGNKNPMTVTSTQAYAAVIPQKVKRDKILLGLGPVSTSSSLASQAPRGSHTRHYSQKLETIVERPEKDRETTSSESELAQIIDFLDYPTDQPLTKKQLDHIKRIQKLWTESVPSPKQ